MRRARELVPGDLFSALEAAAADPLFRHVLRDRPTSEGWEPFSLEDD